MSPNLWQIASCRQQELQGAHGGLPWGYSSGCLSDKKSESGRRLTLWTSLCSIKARLGPELRHGQESDGHNA